tara:strand:+ start:12680 stop:13582 length:903 start_codon:yes stop_codon:yes gene_type:complete
MHRSFCALALGLAGLTGVASAQDADLIFGERTAALAMDQNCDLFSSSERAALEAARLQARGALLRSGISAARLQAYSHDISANAGSRACDAPEVLAMRARVAVAFEGYLRVGNMSFPGDTFSWFANRQVLTEEPVWALLQDTGDIRVGVSLIDKEIRFTIALPSATAYSAAILVMRDQAREPRLYDATLGGMFPGPQGAEWAHWTPPDYARRMVWASDQSDGNAASVLADAVQGRVFRFPLSAVEELAALDPREAARFDLLDSNGQRAATHYFEVGDFAAAVAFLRAAFDQLPESGLPES